MPILATQRYRISDLGLLPGGSGSFARAINNAGWVVGQADIAGSFHATLSIVRPADVQGQLTPDMQDLGTLGGRATFARDVDQAGRVVGYGESPSGALRAFLWPGSGGLQDLGVIASKNCFALGVSVDAAAGGIPQIVGFMSPVGGAVRAFLFVSGQVHDLGSLGGAHSAASAVNEAGQVVGDALTASGHTHAFLYDAARGMLDLGTLGGDRSSATGINTAGQVVGAANTASGATHAFVYEQQQMRDLGTLGGGSSAAWAVNAAGQVVGTAATAGGRTQAFLYDGAMANLNSLLPPGSGWELVVAAGINDLGQIVGLGTHNQQTRGYVMSPVSS